MESFLAITRALSDENRVRALLALRDQEVCVCQIIELLQLAPSTVSKHMTILRQAKLVEGQKRGRWMYYRKAGANAPVEACKALDWICASLSSSPRIREDRKRLAAILKVDRGELCRTQNTR
jgi:ArsR family transcriptional regulator, arsenate/arsenite/antimonite-responsive transcriptional repressor